ncbi:MAG: type II toxin-antitoxin system VapC family toxin [Thiomargarita sp.]|nr:type II toxin-antitoxin system VapC family toxin [Thiomargarita sp.]
MKKRIYIETSIPSFYYENRIDAAAVARREWTRQWWDNHRDAYELVSSQAVVDELNNGNYSDSKRQNCIALLEHTIFLPIENEIASIVQTYLQHKLMPKDTSGDALHLALASYHKCDILLSWNCKNLANVNKFNHIRYVNNLLWLYVPILTTPLELLGENND